MPDKELIDLGYVNGWSEDPEIVNKCCAAKHKKQFETVSRCVRKCTCHECGYFYKIDSSD